MPELAVGLLTYFIVKFEFSFLLPKTDGRLPTDYNVHLKLRRNIIFNGETLETFSLKSEIRKYWHGAFYNSILSYTALTNKYDRCRRMIFGKEDLQMILSFTNYGIFYLEN